MGLRYFFIAFLLQIHKVAAQKVIYGVTGGFVILPCEIKMISKEVFWRYRDSKTVCDIFNGAADFTEQDPAYRNRVNISSEVMKGNYSIGLVDLKISDAGPYTCKGASFTPVTIKLYVTDEEQTPNKKERMKVSPEGSDSSNGQSTRQTSSLSKLILGSALLYTITF